jgi:hypothetical protein
MWGARPRGRKGSSEGKWWQVLAGTQKQREMTVEASDSEAGQSITL